MAKENKFGTFGGVYTPSLLTILGVIMYLRLPWVVGHAGLFGVIGIILVAHVISIATGLSISSIATDKNVGAGGPYYIVSRSLGLPIGGALGLALFIGLCFSTSLYVIGLSESILLSLGIEATLPAVRITGSIALVAITAVTVISTAFAIKTQYVVLVLIAFSLGAIFLGDPSGTVVSQGNSGPAPEMAMLFGIFFPAVTGFTAGVNMSGDLKDPKQAIPRGTMAAIFSGLLVYIALAIFLSTQVSREALISDPNLLANFAKSSLWGSGGILVLLGIWGATFSSGLGSIMGAPRILQALSVDRITPSLFARGTGPTKEPRNALVLAFLIAEAGILIAKLDTIAAIVSMVFLTMYAFLNLSCAIEAKVSPDFRPAFRIPASVSVIGAITCIVIMINLNVVAMIGATIIMVGLFFYLQRKQLTLETGDAWGGVWSTMVRSGLYRVTGDKKKQQRNWRPNILSFRTKSTDSSRFEQFAQTLVTGNGILTDFEIVGDKKQNNARTKSDVSEGPRAKGKSDERPVGIFRKTLRIKDQPFDKIQTLCSHYGFSGLEPNALLLPWKFHEIDLQKFAETIDIASEQDFNVLAYQQANAHPTNASKIEKNETRIDVWWRVEAGNVAFSIALLKFLTKAAQWENAPVRFLLLSADSANNDNLRSTMRRLLREERIDAQVKIVNDTFGDRSFVDRVLDLSSQAALTLIGLPHANEELEGEILEELQTLCMGLGRVLLLRGSSAFAEVLPVGRSAAISELPPMPADGKTPRLPQLTVSDVPDIQNAARANTEAYQRLVTRLSERCLKKLYGRHIELIRGLKSTARKHLTVDEATKTANPRRVRTAFNRQQSAFLLECQDHLKDFTEKQLPDLHSILEGGIDGYLHDDAVVSPSDTYLRITRPKSDLKATPQDTPYIRRFKRQRRIGAWLKRRPPQYTLPISDLQKYYFRKSIDEHLRPAIQAFVTESHQLMVQLGKLLNSSRITLPLEETEYCLGDLFDNQRELLCSHLNDLDAQAKGMTQRRNWALITDSLEMSQAYAIDIARFDFLPTLRKSRVLAAHFETKDLEETSAQWIKNQQKLTERANLALILSGLQHRLRAIVVKEREALKIALSHGALAECSRIKKDLETLAASLTEEKLGSQPTQLQTELKTPYDPQSTIENLMQECGGIADELPISLQTLSDESIQALEEGHDEGIDTVDVPLRRLMQFLTETELIGGLEESLAKLPPQELRAMGVAQDVVRLVNFQLGDLDSAEDIAREDFASQMRPAIENGIERIETEIKALDSAIRDLFEVFDNKLHLVIDGTNAYELSGHTDKLDQHIRVYHGRLAVSGARGLLTRTVGRLRAATVKLMYRRSEGVLLAKARKGNLRSSERSVDRIAHMVRSHVPRPEVLANLPYYYRQLFFGQSGINETFWVGREQELARAKQAISQFDSGQGGSLLVVGDRLSGKSALLQKLGNDLLYRRKVSRVHPITGGSIDLHAFERALRKSLGNGGTSAGETGVASAFSSFPNNSVIIIDDLSLWWERSENGNRVLDTIAAAIQRHGSRLLFVLAIETQAFRLINRHLALSDMALCVLQCPPLPAEALKSIITLRHSSTGLKYRWGKKNEDDLGEVALARLFSQHFEHSGGSVGGTLRSWISAIYKVKGDILDIGPPARRDWESLDSLKDSWVALLLQLALHKHMSVDRLRRVSGLPLHELKDDLEALTRMGLVVEGQRRVLEIEPSIYSALSERFSKRGVFA